jgi:hypothetical protein
MTREQVVAVLDADAIMGNKDAGIYMGQNPIRPGLDEQTAAKDEGVAAYRHALVEFDGVPLEQQFAVILATRLPVSAVVYSGGKSLHAWVRVDAADLETYRRRVGVIHSLPLLAAAGMDKANKNPSRLTRLPGARRKDKVQRVVAVNVGAASWEDWGRSQEQATPAEEPKAEEEERGRPFEVLGYDEEAVVFYLTDLRMERRVKLDELAKVDKLRAIAKESFWKDRFGRGDELKWSAVEAGESAGAISRTGSAAVASGTTQATSSPILGTGLRWTDDLRTAHGEAQRDSSMSLATRWRWRRRRPRTRRRRPMSSYSRRSLAARTAVWRWQASSQTRSCWAASIRDRARGSTDSAAQARPSLRRGACAGLGAGS